MMSKRILVWCLVGAMALSGLSGCAQTNHDSYGLDPSNPVSLTVWHYYTGAQQAAFDALVSEFNVTSGKELGIYVEGYSMGSVGDLEQALTDSAAHVVGAKPLPDIFSTYADTAYALLQQGLLADLSAYFTGEELDEYVPGYIQECYLTDDDGLYLFPIAKSTEVLMLNATDWEPFAQATGTDTGELATTEGIAAVAQRYYEWTDALTPDIPNDGKAFYGRDSMSNYFLIGMKQMGIDLFDVTDGEVTIRAEKEQIRRLWDNYYVPYVNGWFMSLGKFRSDDVKTGDILAYTGSTVSAIYFPDRVETDDESYDVSYLVLPAPVMDGGAQIAVQQGADMAVTKSDPQREYAACQFLKWLTARENNLRFVCESAYLPVRLDANDLSALDEAIESNGLNINAKIYDSLKCVMSSIDEIQFYTPKCFENGYATRKVLDYNLSNKAIADRAAILAQIDAGTAAEDAIAEYVTDEAFETWYRSLCQALESSAHP